MFLLMFENSGVRMKNYRGPRQYSAMFAQGYFALQWANIEDRRERSLIALDGKMRDVTNSNGLAVEDLEGLSRRPLSSRC